MQPYTTAFAGAKITPQKDPISINEIQYQVDLSEGVVVETIPEGQTKYPIKHVIGGKNVFYFLTPLEKGRLQTLPVAYDVNKKEWFDTASSGMRHFPGGERAQVVNWKESPYTFNTACYSCHVSQLSTNYDFTTDTYHTTWAEPGINCETCHGPSAEHNKIAKATPKGQPLTDLRLISTKTMTTQQRNDLCLSCHAKARPLTIEYQPKELFLDHFDVVTLEDPDYYPDGRDLGENYTYTSWSMSPCVKSGKLDCLHCHTSSGRYRFKREKFNDACLPCHTDKVNSPVEHTHHPAESDGNKCISCHMPMTSFARMGRSDHSMLPPTPALTMAYASPNACNNCHQDKDAPWADKYVRMWRTRDYQAPLLQRAALIDAARKRDWSKLPEMVAYIQSHDRDEVFATSLIRLMAASNEDRMITPVLLDAVKDPSPLVRSAAIEAIALRPSPEGVQALLDATGDASRLVRIRAGAGLALFPTDRLEGETKARVEKANQEYLAFLMARPDQWTSHYNMGNYHLNHGELKDALASYQAALEREPQAVMAMVNASIAYGRLRENGKAEELLQSALKLAPDNAAANFNMGLVKAESGELQLAEKYLRNTLKADPQMAQAAYNLCILLSKDRLDEAVTWCRQAAELRPQEPNYAYTYAFFLNQKGDREGALRTLKAVVEKFPRHKDSAMLLEKISSGGKGQ
ncbi:tetratricopeptide repeat protein [Desulfovibrio sp. TomC]|uniref:tetratricopeptide repeat protein n=1 Tax=Desulfovibrio sp. TomC TaxID=1562888 RepID=UPI0018CF6230|nr:tetratricopeptide repeat protein [Desulfovibrio sp. TomC]